MTFQTSVKLRVNCVTNKGSCILLFAQGMQTPDSPLQRFHAPFQSSQGHTTKQEVQHHFSAQANTLCVNYCISQAHVFYQDPTARSLCSCATRKLDVQWERWCCFKQNYKRGSHRNPLGLCLSTACPLEAESCLPTPLTPCFHGGF